MISGCAGMSWTVLAKRRRLLGRSDLLDTAHHRIMQVRGDMVLESIQG